MKAEDLRIGNFVYGVDEGYTETAMEISSLHGDQTFRLKHGNGSVGCYNSSHLNPIPLTVEWIFNFGFKNNKLSVSGILEFIYLKGSIYIRGISGAIHPRECEYVHQLQNLYFALTGCELTIK